MFNCFSQACFVPAKSGVYCIFNLVKARRYIGSSKNMRSRWGVHYRRMMKGVSDNSFLLSDSKKTGLDAFICYVLEECPIEELEKREQFWIDRFYDGQKFCYNIRKLAFSNQGLVPTEQAKQNIRLANKTKVKCELVDPQGNLHNALSYREFSVKYGLDYRQLRCVVRGTRHAAAGWRRKEFEGTVYKNPRSRKIQVGLRSPDGTIYRDVVNVREFCRVHGLHPWQFRRFVEGTYGSMKGWSLVSDENEQLENVAVHA